MKKLFISVMIALSVMGCATTEKIEPPVVVKQEYILRVPPKEAFEIPSPVPNIDVDKADQADVARWIAAMVERMDELEKRIHEIAKFLDDEQKKLDTEKK